MNLFEAQLSKMTSPDNSIYMESVVQMFNILFENGELPETNPEEEEEDTPPEIVDANAATQEPVVADQADQVQAEANSDDEEDDDGEYIILFGDRRKLIDLVKPTVDLAQSISRVDYLAPYAGNGDKYTAPYAVINKMAERIEDGSISDASFYKTVLAECNKMIKSSEIGNFDQFMDGFNKYVRKSCTPELAKTLRLDMAKYLRSINVLIANLDQFKKTTGAEMLQRRRTDPSLKKRKKKLPTLTVGPDGQLVMSGPAKLKRPKPTKIKETKSSKPTKVSPKSTGAGVSETPEPEDESPDYSSLEGKTIKTVDTGVGESSAWIEFTSENANAIADYMRDSWNVLVKARRRAGLRPEPVTISVDNNRVRISYSQSGDDMEKVSMYRIAIYCVYCDLLRRDAEYHIDPIESDSTMSYPVADSIIHDRKRSRSLMDKYLFPKSLEALDLGDTTLSEKNILSSVPQLNPDNIVDKYIRDALVDYGQTNDRIADSDLDAEELNTSLFNETIASMVKMNAVKAKFKPISSNDDKKKTEEITEQIANDAEQRLYDIGSNNGKTVYQYICAAYKVRNESAPEEANKPFAPSELKWFAGDYLDQFLTNDGADKYLRDALVQYVSTYPDCPRFDDMNKFEFNNAIAEMAYNKYNEDLEYSGKAMLKNQNTLTPSMFVSRVDSFNNDGKSMFDIFTNLYSESAKIVDLKISKYNEDATRVVTACRNQLENKNDLHYIPVSASSMTTTNNGQIADLLDNPRATIASPSTQSAAMSPAMAPKRARR